MDFNPRFPRGKRLSAKDVVYIFPAFQSTLPAGEATRRKRCGHCLQDISIHASRGGSDTRLAAGYAGGLISIHASRGGSDICYFYAGVGKNDFNPRFPRGKRPIKMFPDMMQKKFQSTLPAGEATIRDFSHAIRSDFNPRFPRGKRLKPRMVFPVFSNFNPRFPRGKRPVSV